MIDKATDLANIEQVVLVIRSVNDNLTVTEDFIGLYKLNLLNLLHLLVLSKMSYFGWIWSWNIVGDNVMMEASSMTGVMNGVAKQLTDEEPRTIFTHCYDHALNLAVGDSVKNVNLRNLALTAFEITKLITKSPKRDTIFQKLKHDLATDTPSFRVLCPTRWTVHAASPTECARQLWSSPQCLGGIQEFTNWQWNEGQNYWYWNPQMLTFNFLLGISLGTLILQHSDNLSKSLQHDTITAAAAGQQLAKLTIDVFKSIRKEDKFKSFYDHVLLHQSEFVIDEPTLSRKRRAPRRLQIGLTDGNFHSTPEDNYRQTYHEAIDLVIEAINSRFNQPGYKVYRNVEDFVLNPCLGCPYDTDLSNVCDFYKDDISKIQLQAQLPLLQALFAEEKNQSELSINDMHKPLSQLSSAQRLAFSMFGF